MLDEALLEYYANYKRTYVENQEEFRKRVEEWFKTKKKFFLGVYNATELKKEKLINEQHTFLLKGIKFTFSEIAKALLKKAVPKKKGRLFPFRKEDFFIMQDNFAGLYAKAGIYNGAWVYLDIKAFYFTIYSRFLAIQYRRGKYILRRKDIALTNEQKLFLQTNKKLRNTVFGIMRSTSKVEVVEGVRRIVPAHNRFLNPQLANFTYDLSKAIAHEMITRFNAVYYNTDGCILPVENYESAKAFVEELGFKVDIKAIWQDGVIVKAVGVYGGINPNEFRTLHFEKVHLKEGKIFTNIDLDVEEVERILTFVSKF